MKNILFITTMYPTSEWSLDTPVCHYFTKEWIKMGYNVRVIHYQSIFPIIFYWILAVFPRISARFIGNDKNNRFRRRKTLYYNIDGVSVESIPIFKFIPHGKYDRITISKQIRRIVNRNQSDAFSPNLIVGHFHNPQLEIIAKLRNIYPKAITCIVLHEEASSIRKTYPKHHSQYMENIDVWGFRYLSLRDEFANTYGNNFDSFITHSGIPDKYITHTNRKFENGVKKYCYVGQLIALKRVEDILFALDKAFLNKDYELSIVGEGTERLKLEEKTLELGIHNQVKFRGELPRDVVQQIMFDSDCFIMVSESEAFGLVYLEAMGKGCITIGTKGQGIDGVIIHGVNGFLCENDSIQLAELLKHINSLTLEELSLISQNAVKTALEMTESNVARKYIDEVRKFSSVNRS
jgi:L-malate glycosyltransferase